MAIIVLLMIILAMILINSLIKAYFEGRNQRDQALFEKKLIEREDDDEL